MTTTHQHKGRIDMNNNLPRRDFLRYAAGAAFSAVASRTFNFAFAAQQQNRLNVLLITADDMNYDTPGFTGCRVPDITPNLDKLAAQSIWFKNAHVTVAVCQPSRSVLFTGMHAHRNGVDGFKPIKDSVTPLT